VLPGLAFLAILAVFWPDFRDLGPLDTPRLHQILFPDALKDGSVTGNGWLLQPGGLALRPGDSGTIRLEAARNPGKQLIVDLSVEDHVGAFLTVQAEDPPFRFQVDNQHADSTDITRLLGDATKFSLELECSDGREAGDPALAVRKVVLIEQRPLFPLPVLAFFLGSFLVIFFLSRTALRTEFEVRIAFAASLVGWVVLHALTPEAMRNLSQEVFLLLLGLLGWRWLARKEFKASSRAVEGLAGLAILLLALNERWEEMGKLTTRTLDPDPAAYLELAGQSRFFFDSEFREPLFVFCAKAGGWLFGATPMGLRITTLLLSLLAVGLTWRVGRDLFSPPVGLFAAAFLALNRNFVYINIRGYRIELFTALTLAFLWFCLGKRDWRPGRRTLALALTGALVCLTQTNSFLTLVAMLVLVFLRNRWPKRMLAVVAVVPLLAMVPSMIYWQQKFGDPMLAVNQHLKYYRNIEFADHPSVPAEGGPYRGPDTDSVRYFLTQWHTPAQTVSNIASGLYQIFGGEYGWRYVFLGSSLLMGLCLLGLARWALTSQWLLLAWLFLLSAPVAFFQPISLDFRLILHILPLLGLAAGDFLQAFWGYFRVQTAASAESKPGEPPKSSQGDEHGH
jgi:hypothetical protein